MCLESPLPVSDRAGASPSSREEFPTEGELQALFQLLPEMLCIAGGDGYFKRVNPAFETALGYSAGELLSRPFIEFVHPDDRQRTQDVLRELMIGVPVLRFENRYRCRDGSYRWLSWQAMPQAGHGRIYAGARDVTHRKETERRDSFTRALLKVFSEKGSRKGYLDSIVEIIRDWLGCRCVDIRIADEDGQVPHELRAGLASLAVIPIRYREQIVGAVHIADEREGMAPPASIEFIESMAPLIGEAVHRFSVEEEIEAQLRTQIVLGKFLHISLEAASLEEQLQHTLDLLLSLPWISLQSKGSIFLAEEDSKTLVRKVQRGLARELLAVCSEVPFGKCHCGQAAATHQIVFADCADARHDMHYPGMPSHGHYCVPILSGDRLIGSMCLYVDAGHRRKPAEETFLVSVADVLAGIIRRKQSEKRVSENEAQLLAAQRIQEHLLPKQAPKLTGFDIAGASYPAEFTGGDTFDYLAMQDGSLGVAVGDVTGHGFAPALLIASTHAYLRLLAQTSSDVGKILTRVNRILVEETEDDRFVTCFLGRLDAQGRSFTYGSAGHPTCYLLDASGNVKRQLQSIGLPLGVSPDAEFASRGPWPLEPGDLLLLVTDGLQESQSPQGEPFGDGRMLEIVRKLCNQPSRSIIEGLHRAALDFCRREKPLDDVTVVVLKCSDTPP